MWLKKFKVVNLGPFVEFGTTLKRGSIGIFGKNGSGKSTLVNLMYGLVTGDFGRFGIKLDAVRNTADKKDEAYVSGTVIHDNRTLTIVRNFKPTKNNPGVTVTIDDGKPIHDSNKAQKEIDEFLGVDGGLLDRYVFKRAESMYDFIGDIPSVRAKQLQILCRTEGCEDLYELLGKELVAASAGQTTAVDDSDTLAQELADAEAAVADLTDRRETTAGWLVKPKFVEAFKEVLEMERARVKAVEALPDAAAQVKATKAAFEAAEEAWTEANEAADKLRGEVRATEKDAPAKRKRVVELEDAAKVAVRLQKLRRDAQTLAAEKRGKLQPPAPDKKAYDEQIENGNELRAKLKKAKATLQAFDDTGLAECPTCGTAVEHLTSHLADCRAAVDTIPGTLAVIAKLVAAYDDAASRVRVYEQWKADYEKRVAANAAGLAALDGSTEADPNELAELESELNELAETQSALSLAESKATTLDRIQQRKKGEHQTAVTLHARVKQAIEDNEVADGEVEKATKRLGEHRDAELALAGIDGELRGQQRLVDAKKEAIVALRTKAARLKKLRQMASILEAAREVFHRNCLPRLVAKENLSRMEGEINDGLEGFDSPFWVETDDQLTFIAHKPGEPPMRASQLSTGQKVMLAICFWSTVATLWATDLGMLALDEPTANLDAANRRLLAESLGSMSAKIRNRRQLILVTHDHDLRSSFDQIIDLDA